MQLTNVVFPAPLGPMHAQDLALADRQVHAGDRGETAEPLRELADLEGAAVGADET